MARRLPASSPAMTKSSRRAANRARWAEGRRMDLGLANSVAVVTGGSSGIGLATAKLLLAEGARVAICGRDAKRLAAAQVELASAAPGAVIAVPCDVTKSD